MKSETFTQAAPVEELDAAVCQMNTAVRLFGTAAAQGVTESRIVEALRRQVFPSLKTEELQHLAKIFSHDRSCESRDSEVDGNADGKRQQLDSTTEDGDTATHQAHKAQRATETTITTQQ